MIINRIYEWARTTPTQPALISDNASLSYASFARAINASRDFFSRQLLPITGIAVVISHHSLDVWLLVMGLRAIGLDTIVVRSISQLETLNVRNVVCIAVNQNHPNINDLKIRTVAHAKIIVVPAEIYTNIRSNDIPSLAQNGNTYGGHILYTSGSTGTYKKVLRSNVHEPKSAERLARLHSFNQNTVFHANAFGLWTATGFGTPLAVWHVGGCIVLDDRNDRFQKFFQYRPTASMLLPPHLRMLLENQGEFAQWNEDLELFVGGGFLSLQNVQNIFRQITRKITLWYASTECSAILSSPFSREEDLYWFSPHPDRTVQIVDEKGENCPVGHEGELRVLTTGSDCISYMDDDRTSAMVFRDGFFYPGDLAIKRADGRIRILGRISDVLNLQGQKMAVGPIEEKIRRGLSVKEVCLFSRLNDDGNEQLVIALETDRNLQRSEIEPITRDFLTFQLISVVPVKLFPRLETGMKIDRRALRQFVFEQIDMRQTASSFSAKS